MRKLFTKKTYSKVDTFGTLFSEAIQRGDFERCKELIAGCKHVNIADEMGRTPLYQATVYHHIELIKLLIEAGADVNAPSTFNHTPLLAAVIHHDVELVQYFVGIGADPSITTNTPYRSFKYKGAEENHNPISLAVKIGNVEIIRAILGL